MSNEVNIDINKIIKLLPHRYPILLVDRVLELDPRSRIKALKNVSANEPYFQGHFPDYPVMPGVLILESLAQASALLAFSEENNFEESQQSPEFNYWIKNYTDQIFLIKKQKNIVKNSSWDNSFNFNKKK